MESRQLLAADSFFSLTEAIEFNGSTNDHVEIPHSQDFALAEGTYALTFSVEDTDGRQTLLSKDHRNYQDGGHLTAWVNGDRVEVRYQSDSKSETVRSAAGSVIAGEDHHVAITFGEEGLRLYVDGRTADGEIEFDQGMQLNTNSLILGASAVRRDGDRPNLRDALEGTIEAFDVYPSQLSPFEIADLVGVNLGGLETPAEIDGVLVGTDAGESLSGSNVNGSYGDDEIDGTSEDDVLDGGHGEDIIRGGEGDDLLISRSDAREPQIAQDYDPEDDDPYSEINPTTRTLYEEQPIAADDLLIGGPGADTFRFEVLINAKERFLFEHTHNNGHIHWHGVAGENNLVHDHWVDALGDEVIADFDRAEGDRIEVVGHTVDVYELVHLDSDDDGVLDASRLYVQSNQGNAGAHNRDQLGTITVYGDLVRWDDVLVDAGPAYGIVDTIGELTEALTPRVYSPVVTPGESRWLEADVDEAPLPPGAIFSVGQSVDFNGEKSDHIQIPHDEDFALAEGTYALAFSVDETDGRQTLLSKDHRNYQDGGHLTAWVNDDRVEVRYQSESKSETVRSAVGSVIAGEDHHVAITFGEEGLRLYVDGRTADGEIEFDQGMQLNTNSLILGASTVRRDGDRPNLRDALEGTIEAFDVYPSQLSPFEIAELVGVNLGGLETPTEIDGVLLGTDAGESLSGSNVNGSYGDDEIDGTSEDDVLDGGHGEDIIRGGEGDDLLISRSDAREPQIAQDYDPEDDDPYSEINPTTRTLYEEQPIAADDLLIGGLGADTFRFEVLINAKERFLFEHTHNNGHIHWHGVAGENNLVHDHWVDALGDEVIADFDREEGDRIEVVGHTVDVYELVHLDSDDDGVLDASRLYVQSNQGNAGAHNRDQLGTITVYGDLVRWDDVLVDAGPAYGIVDTIGELTEALAPRVYSPVVTPGESRWLEADVDEAPLPPGAIFSVGQSVDFNGEKSDHIQIPHDEDFELAEGTYALTFRVEDTRGRQTLLSKDHRGYQEGGHLTAWVNGDRVEARYQSDSKSETVRSGRGAVDAGEEHHLAISFGDDGLRLYLDGQLVDSEDDFDQGMQLNTNSLVLGASTVRRDGDRSNLRDAFEGTILSFELYGSQLNDDSISDLANGLSGIAGQSIQSGGGAVARGDSLSIKSTNLPGSTTSKLTSTGDDVGGMSSYSRSTAWQLDQADDDERIWDAESVDAALHSLLTHHVG